MRTNGYHTYYIYILSNKYRTTLYTGVTNNLRIRLQQHLDGIATASKSFSARYRCAHLIY